MIKSLSKKAKKVNDESLEEFMGRGLSVGEE
jgi:hypothetical protein